MRRHKLVGADISDADDLCYEADDIDRQSGDGEAADDATERAGRNVAVPVEQTYGFVQFELDGCECGAHNSYLTPHRPDRYGPSPIDASGEFGADSFGAGVVRELAETVKDHGCLVG
jgi:hypothetical protein